MKKNMMMRIASVLLVAVLLSTCAISGTFAKYTSSASGSDKARVAYWGWGQDASNFVNLKGLFLYSYGDVESPNIGTEGANVHEDVIAPGTTNSVSFTFKYVPNTNSKVNAPEVKYDFTVSVEGSVCDPLIQSNKNIIWYLDGQKAPAVMNGNTAEYAEGSWNALMSAILSLSGKTTKYVAPTTGESAAPGVVSATETYVPGDLPDAFDNVKATEENSKLVDNVETHTISWEWKFVEESEDTTKYIIDSDNAVTYATEGSTADAISQDAFDTYMANMADLEDVTIVITITVTQVNEETTAPATPEETQ